MRSFLAKDELKYRDVVSANLDMVLGRFPSPQARRLGNLLIRESSAATVFLVDSEIYAQGVFRSKLDDGAEFTRDFNFRDVVNEVKEQIINDVPLYWLRPSELMTVLDPFSGTTRYFRSTSEVAFDARSVLRQIGGGLRDAEVFAARAYSLLDVEGLSGDDGFAAAHAPWSPPTLQRHMLYKVLSKPRVFDRDHAASVRVLNESVSALQSPRFRSGTTCEQLIREEDSRAVDALQAADIAAGFARDVLDRKGLRAVAAQFRKVILNGTDVSQFENLS